MTLTALFSIVVAIIALAIVLWGGDRILAEAPGNEKLKRIVRILIIVIVSLWLLATIAGLLGVGMPWNLDTHYRHR